MSATQPTMSYQAMYRSCIKEAAAQGRTLMQRMVRRAAIATAERTQGLAQRERKHVAEAARVLMKHEAPLSESYPQALLSEFAHAISGSPQATSALSFDSLELMGDEQMQESVDLMRLQQSVTNSVEFELSELNTLMCAAQGLKKVQIDRNPLRPEVYVRSLRSVILQSPVPQDVRKLWLHALGEALGPELARAYKELCESMREKGIGEAGFNLINTTPVRPTANANDDAAQQASTLLNVKELRRLLTGELGLPRGMPENESAHPDFSATVPAAFEVLQEMRQVDEVVKRLHRRQASGADPARSEALHQQLQREARGAGQALGLEVVNLMVENIASDTRLLPPVQHAVRELEPALLRLALVDPRFFSDRKHPARQLLEQMTQRSLAWQSEDSPGFEAFMEPLLQAVEVLVSTRAEGADPFEYALTSLEEAWGDLQKRDRRYREKAVRALLQAEQRNLLAAKIARELRTRPDLLSAPREVAAFVAGPWAQVMAQARLSDTSGATDPGGHAALVADMLWSAQPRVASTNPAKLQRLMPLLQHELRNGLATIDYPLPATQRFLDQLAALHQRALAGDAQASRPVPLSTTLTPDELLALAADQEDNESDVPGAWLAPTEAQHSGFVETHQSIAPKPLFQPTQAGFSDTRPRQEELAPSMADTGLRPGSWVEMLTDGNWVRNQLTWASPHATLFMFADAGGTTHSMTRRLLDKMLKSGALRIVSDQAVVDGALDQVAQAALRNSLDLKL
jgi:hypothetical protein